MFLLGIMGFITMVHHHLPKYFTELFPSNELANPSSTWMFRSSTRFWVVPPKKIGFPQKGIPNDPKHIWSVFEVPWNQHRGVGWYGFSRGWFRWSQGRIPGLGSSRRSPSIWGWRSHKNPGFFWDVQKTIMTMGPFFTTYSQVLEAQFSKWGRSTQSMAT